MRELVDEKRKGQAEKTYEKIHRGHVMKSSVWARTNPVTSDDKNSRTGDAE